jgi:hypothetical protein
MLEKLHLKNMLHGKSGLAFHRSSPRYQVMNTSRCAADQAQPHSQPQARWPPKSVETRTFILMDDLHLFYQCWSCWHFRTCRAELIA